MRRELARFIARFDAAQYWAAHEELEPAWLRDRDPELQGLIHLAAALLHAERGNLNGARRKLSSGLDMLGASPAIDELPLQPIREAMSALLARLDSTLAGPAVARGEWTVTGAMPKLGSLLADPAAIPEVEPQELPYRVRRYEDGYRIGRDPARRDGS